MFRNRWSVLASALLLAAAVQADPVCIRFEGTVAELTDWGGVLGDLVRPGDPIEGAFVYDTDAADTNPLPSVGDYEFTTAPYGMHVGAGGLKVASRERHTRFLVELVNDHLGRDNLVLHSYFNDAENCHVPVEHVSWQLDDPTMRALGSTVLGKDPPRLDAWQSLFGITISGVGGSNDFFIRGHATRAEACTGPGSTTAAVQASWRDVKSLYR